MPTLSGLPGTNGKDRKCIFVSSVSGLQASLRKLKASNGITAANDDGAFNIWRDDEGYLRCQSFRYLVTQDTQKFKKVKDVLDWSKIWFKKIGY